MPLFIEKAQDEMGTRYYISAVIEGLILDGHLKIEKPTAFRQNWARLPARYFQEISSEAGSARMLDTGDCSEKWKKMDELIAKYAIR